MGGRSSRVREKLLDSGSVLEVMPVGSDDGLAVLCKRESHPGMLHSEVLGSATW